MLNYNFISIWQNIINFRYTVLQRRWIIFVKKLLPLLQNQGNDTFYFNQWPFSNCIFYNLFRVMSSPGYLANVNEALELGDLIGTIQFWYLYILLMTALLHSAKGLHFRMLNIVPPFLAHCFWNKKTQWSEIKLFFW